jgi:pilus retraction protein PilT
MAEDNLIKYLSLCERVNASDLHLKAGQHAIARVSGVLKELDDQVLDNKTIFSYIDRILTDKQKQEFALNQDVDSSFTIGDKRYRCNAYCDINGYSLSIRRIMNQLGDFRQLGIPEVLKHIVVKKSGLILVTGPTGSGKSTTLASLINFLNENVTAHIITIEDPIEYIYTPKRCMITQREIGRDAANFARALRAAMRQDPDIILIGELRDLESIQTALSAAETGHLVLSTLHTMGAENSIDRIIDVFPPEQQMQIRTQLSMVLLAVMSQQLVPNVEGGRSLASEVMICNSAIKSIIRSGKTQQLANTMMTSRNAGMYSMEQCLEQLYRMGIITLDNFQLYTPQTNTTKSTV